jgi:hypothetical protein
MSGEPFEIRFENVSVDPTRDDSLFRAPGGAASRKP